MPSSSQIGYGLSRGLPAEEHELIMRDRSQRPQLSVAVAEVGWGRLEAQLLNRSDGTNAVPTAKQKTPPPA